MRDAFHLQRAEIILVTHCSDIFCIKLNCRRTCNGSQSFLKTVFQQIFCMPIQNVRDTYCKN